MFQQTVKNFNISFSALNERNSFSGGDLITGQISFELTKQTRVDVITMALTGKASVAWSVSGGGGRRGRGRGRRGRRGRRQRVANLEFFKLKSVIDQPSGGEASKLQTGTHVYQFTCQIPHGDFPSSFTGISGKIAYTLTVGIVRPWHLSKDFVTELNFVGHIDTNHPELWAPLSGSNKMTFCCLWCASGPIAMTASTEKKAFNPGETVRIICDFSNSSSRTATPKLKLQQKQSFYTHDRVSQRVVFKNLASLAGEPLRAHSSDVHAEFTLPIPPTAELTISNCSILQVDYMVEVALSVAAAHDLVVMIPIILCDTPANIHRHAIS
ncbi:arrestin domain-containing protein 3-like [Brachionichthys hirsutus]|uniref:arrestin domain-containing protein 3-like n=1 Tax=Brachionichthys hirsutus TaxID=412623 RepID=UPI003604D576